MYVKSCSQHLALNMVTITVLYLVPTGLGPPTPGPAVPTFHQPFLHSQHWVLTAIVGQDMPAPFIFILYWELLKTSLYEDNGEV